MLIKKRRSGGLLLLATLLVLSGCMFLKLIDITTYGGSNVDVGQVVISSQGYIYAAGMTYGRYLVARITSDSGVLAPGTEMAPWGFGFVNDNQNPVQPPTTSPVGWVGIVPG